MWLRPCRIRGRGGSASGRHGRRRRCRKQRGSGGLLRGGPRADYVYRHRRASRQLADGNKEQDGSCKRGALACEAIIRRAPQGVPSAHTRQDTRHGEQSKSRLERRQPVASGHHREHWRQETTYITHHGLGNSAPRSAPPHTSQAKGSNAPPGIVRDESNKGLPNRAGGHTLPGLEEVSMQHCSMVAPQRR